MEPPTKKIEDESRGITYHENIDVDKLQQIVKKVSDSKITFAMVTCPNPHLQTFDVIESAEKEGGIAAIRTEKELRKYFEDFRKLFIQKTNDQNTGWYIPYDFGFYLDEDKEDFRSNLFVIVFIPESLNPRAKVFYSVELKSFSATVKIAKTITITNVNQLTYENLLWHAKGYQTY